MSIGSGHLMRCLSLARNLRQQGADITFFCRKGKGDLLELLEQNRFPVVTLDELENHNTSAVPGDTSAQRVNEFWHIDASETVEKLGKLEKEIDWMIVDHYELGADWEARIKTKIGKIMVIDDMANRNHDCDVLLDQNLVAEMETRYSGRIPDSCLTLFGPKYALLQEDYAEFHSLSVIKRKKIDRILIYFGAADTDNLTGKSLRAFLALGKKDIVVDLIVGPVHASYDVLKGMAGEHDNINFIESVSSLAPLLLKADLSVGAAGASSWERICMMTSSIVISLADNQVPIASELDRRGLVNWLGPSEEVDENDIKIALEQCIQRGVEPELFLNSDCKIDGYGCKRVSSILFQQSNHEYKARRVSNDDEQVLLQWSNDTLTRENAFTKELITEETHRTWFSKRLQDKENCLFYIVENGQGEALGPVRFEQMEECWEVHYSVAPEFRRKGMGVKVLSAAMKQFHLDNAGDKPKPVIGRVKIDNMASRRIFEKLGFLQHESSSPDIMVFRESFQ